MFNFPAFLNSLPIMLKGMLGIFCVIGIILISTLTLNSVFTNKKSGN